MTVTVQRRLVPELKVEQVTITDSFGARHIVQQPIMPLAEAKLAVEKAAPEQKAAAEAELQIVRDWHEATIEMQFDLHQKREEAVAIAREMLPNE